ncbi:segregation and condensation protein A [Thermoclostridium stercorarium subsp. stercorarium DSM 8532]|jgi:segregation and condensation protein A|uniref:Segregation and condensation protein A n=3 Tax=Thermoclostridium stercorarium TaxID=1510 RepID=L7VM50_THES1|nr:segregation/condensation protein A [Thermoclostridium stercorarium]AGC67576.1 segregation and condensation protein A [Thermoclostridium stercorarium subsp. stercorarium DSM 8532]AGI38625.1 ScpA [Thermoclostridium stercorarium subsp. stercorarium DSM 8532]ANW97998.1 chromosome segregation protein ScpA [Thermoclostridium stercorarium subsp. thermolacticum DSM 2910]ANX00547.1 chromosome segregation protein ScpA [Thermoclostridium stercorarium subsp. leptospartum DSM 9219]UZQ86160.1 segregation
MGFEHTASPADVCTIKLKNFEGPLDLLFYLIEKNQINIYDIPIVEITDQYMEYLFAMQQMDLEIASEFLVMAATLLHIKSKLLLPSRKEEEQEEEDPREELVVKLVEYKRIKEFAEILKEREQIWSRVYYKLPEALPESVFEEILDVSPLMLKECYLKCMQNYYERQNDVTHKMERILRREQVSLRLKIKELLARLKRGVKLCFSQLYNLKHMSRIEVATGFLATLEVAKMGRATIYQKEEFGEIYIEPKVQRKG